MPHKFKIPWVYFFCVAIEDESDVFALVEEILMIFYT